MGEHRFRGSFCHIIDCYLPEHYGSDIGAWAYISLILKRRVDRTSTGVDSTRRQYVDGGDRRVTLLERVRLASFVERSRKKLGIEGYMIVGALNSKTESETARVFSVETKAGF